MAWPDSFEASFDVTSLLTNLFVGDDWPAAEVNPDPKAWAAEAARHTGNWADTVPLHPMPALSPGQRRKLFHERVHYWQLMSLPLQQAEFILDLEQIKATAMQNGGKMPGISGMTYGTTLSEGELYQGRQSVRANFVTPKFEELHLFNPAATANLVPDRGIGMPFAMFPWGAKSDNKALPAYLGMIFFHEVDNFVLVPFSGRNLLESAAYLCEKLREGELPERLEPSCSAEDIQYTGAWDFWLRLHGHRYASEEDLALGFLAAVDLAMCSDFDPHESELVDDDERAIWTSIPYRFGQIASGLQAQPPLLAGSSPEESIAEFQAKFCKWCGLPAPDVIVRKALGRVTKCLALHMSSPSLKKHQDAIVAIVRTPDWELASRTAELEAFWPIIAQDLANASPLIGQTILWVMLNALRFRLRHPGRFAAPHIYESELSALFPLPLLSRDGMYYPDQTNPAASAAAERSGDSELRSDIVDLLHDCLSMMTASPLRSGTVECGFLAKAVPCWYQHCGLGCPTIGLRPDQAKTRRRTGLGNWCHWEQRRLRLDLPAHPDR